jgi:hypothetical protein
MKSAYMIDKTCGKQLDKLTKGGIEFWGHSSHMINEPDHEVEPVEYDESILISVCDFCHDEVPLAERHFLPVADYRIIVSTPEGDAELNNVGGYNCCPTCASLVAADDWDGLVRRYTTLHAGIDETILKVLWTAVRSHILGPVRNWLPGDELSGQDDD